MSRTLFAIALLMLAGCRDARLGEQIGMGQAIVVTDESGNRYVLEYDGMNVYRLKMLEVKPQ